MTVETRNITKLFGRQKALDDVSFQIKKGELVGFLGPNGAGKSTMMKIITGFLPQDSGKIFINDQQISSNDLDVRKTIGYLPEQNPLYTDLYIKEFLEITAGFYKLANKKQRVAEMIELTGLGDEQHKKIRALSKGYRQRVGLAQALIHDPSILILDEPTTGLDPNQLEEIRDLIRRVGKEKTVILSSHIMQEVEAVCNRVIIIKKGQIAADGSISDLKNKSFSNSQIVLLELNSKIEKNKLLELPWIKNAELVGTMWEIEAKGEDDIRPGLFQFAVDNKLIILTLKEQQKKLENVFQELTQD